MKKCCLLLQSDQKSGVLKECTLPYCINAGSFLNESLAHHSQYIKFDNGQDKVKKTKEQHCLSYFAYQCESRASFTCHFQKGESKTWTFHN